MRYEITVRGELGAGWGEWCGGLTATPDAGGNTVLAGEVADQAALFGVLRRVRDAGLVLVGVASGAQGEDVRAEAHTTSPRAGG
jgi:hypothetical protein